MSLSEILKRAAQGIKEPKMSTQTIVIKQEPIKQEQIKEDIKEGIKDEKPIKEGIKDEKQIKLQ